MERFSQFLHIREQIASHLSTVTTHIQQLGGTARVAHLQAIERDLLSNSFRVLICGEFKRGKSCLINALLGSPVVPMKVAPCTGSVTELTYGQMPLLTVYPEQGRSFSAPFDELRNYATIQGEKGNSLRKVRVEYPSEICRKAITLIDSPGLNEDWSRTKASLREIATADALLLVLSCEMALSRSEMEFINSHLRPHQQRLFFIWNRYDSIWDDPVEESALRDRSDTFLRGYSDKIFFLSAREALLAHIQNDEDRLDGSCLPDFVDSLEQYLLRSSAAQKLLPSWQMTLQSISYAQDTLIPRLERLLQNPLHTLQEILESTNKNLADLELQRKEIRETIQEMLTNILEDVIQATDEYITHLPSEVFSASKYLELPEIANRQEREDTILNWFGNWFQQSLHQFGHQTIRHTLEANFEELRLDIDSQRQRFYQKLYRTLQEESDDIILFEGKWIEELSIVLSTSVSVMLINIGRDKVLNALLEVRALRAWLTGTRLGESDRRKLANRLAQAFTEQRESIIADLRSHLEEAFDNMQRLIDRELELSIKDAIQQIQYALSIREQGIAYTEEQRLRLEDSRLVLYNIRAKLLEVKEHVRRT